MADRPADLAADTPPRVDAVLKVTGRAEYVGDLRAARMLHGKVLRSNFPHAVLGGVDTSAAERLPGVRAVLAGRHLHPREAYYGHAVIDRPIVAIDKVRYLGEPVAAVAADTPAVAEAALDLIKVEYHELPPVLDVERALEDGSPLVHEQVRAEGLFHGLDDLVSRQRTNLCYHSHLESGNTEAGFREADLVLEGEYRFPMVYHYAMEPFAMIACADDRGITLWANAQHPHIVQAELARMFGFPRNKVRVIVPFVGGGFGSKGYLNVEPLAVVLSRLAGGRPVRLEFSIAESMLTHRRHSMRCYLRTGVTRAGEITALECRLFFDTGAFADNGPRVTRSAVRCVPRPYRIANFTADGYAVYTNTVPAGSFRAIGTTQTVWAREAHLDEIAHRLGFDPAEFRRRNLLRQGEIPFAGAKPLDADLHGDLATLRAALEWPSEDPAGRGLALAALEGGASPVSMAALRLHADGSVTLLCSTIEIGQGAQTVLSQLAARELGLPRDRIRFARADTLGSPFDRSTGASRSTTVMGLAVFEAARSLKAKLLSAGEEIWGDKTPVEVREGRLWCGAESMAYADAVQRYFGVAGGELIGIGTISPDYQGGRLRSQPMFYEIGIGGAVVRLDRETGEIRVIRIVSVADVGRAINPHLCEGQEHGAMMQGLGHTLFEEMVYERGQLLNPSVLEYRVPAMIDMPDLVSVLVENEDGPGPYGAKGIGEGGIVAIAPAVTGAIGRLTGVWIRELPLTPERVWKALRTVQPAASRPGA